MNKEEFQGAILEYLKVPDYIYDLIKETENKEENKMGKTFREVIADIKEGEVWESIYTEISMGLYGIEIKSKNGFTKDTICLLPEEGGNYKLQRKEYSFDEAFKAYEEGKEIESEYGYIYKKINGEDFVCEEESWEENEESFALDEIRGKWYIND